MYCILFLAVYTLSCCVVGDRSTGTNPTDFTGSSSRVQIALLTLHDGIYCDDGSAETMFSSSLLRTSLVIAQAVYVAFIADVSVAYVSVSTT